MNNEALSYKGTSYAKADVFLYNYDYLFNSVGLALVPRAKVITPFIMVVGYMNHDMG